jgi:hypothetical protein
MIEHHNGTILNSIVGVPASKSVKFATIPINDDAAAGHLTGYAIANPGSKGIPIRIEVFDTAGRLKSTIVRPVLLGAGAQIARFLWEELGNPTLRFQGSLTISSEGNSFVAAGLVLNHGLMTVVPVIEETR